MAIRRLEINGTKVDIDEKTAIGINFKAYDVANVGATYTNDSNTFSVPKTSNNLAMFGNFQDHQSTSKIIYNENICNYWVNGTHHLVNSKISVKSITDRINLYSVNKLSFWDIAKKTAWNDFVYNYILWLQDTKGLPSLGVQQSWKSYSQVITGYTDEDGLDGVILPIFISGLEKDNVAPYNGIELNNEDQFTGGHFCSFVKTIFEYIEFEYNINFGVSEVGLNGNVWDDIIAQSLYIPIRNLLLREVPTSAGDYYFEIPSDWTTEFSPYGNFKANEDKTLHDFVSTFFRHMNILKDEITVNNVDIVRLSRFDDISVNAEVVDYSSRFDKIKAKKPLIKGYAQNNYIKFGSIYENGSEFLNSKVLTCLNKNINVEKNLFTIDAYIGNVRESGVDSIIDLSENDSYKTFSFLLNAGVTSSAIDITVNQGTTESAVMQKAAFYDLNSEYNVLNTALDYPIFYEVQRWMTNEDIRKLEFFKLYYFRQLGGSYFLNAVKGFNPEKSKKSTTLELFKINDRAPNPVYDREFFIDDSGDYFVDDSGNKFY